MTGGTWGPPQGRPSPSPRSTPGRPQLEGETHRPRHARADTGEVRTRTGQDWPTPPRAAPALAAVPAGPEGPQGAPAPSSGPLLSNFAVSALRTYVPLIWGVVVSWGITRWPPLDDLLDATGLTVTGPVVLTALATAGWYSLWRWLEPHVPDVLTAILLGHPQAPYYPDKKAGG